MVKNIPWIIFLIIFFGGSVSGCSQEPTVVTQVITVLPSDRPTLTPTPCDGLWLEDFDFLRGGMSLGEIMYKVHDYPDDQVGSGLYIYIYKLCDGRIVELGFGDLSSLLYGYIYSPKENLRTSLVPAPPSDRKIVDFDFLSNGISNDLIFDLLGGFDKVIDKENLSIYIYVLEDGREVWIEYQVDHNLINELYRAYIFDPQTGFTEPLIDPQE